MYIKKKLGTCRVQIQDEKVWVLKKKPTFKNFPIFFQKFQSKKIFFPDFSKFPNLFFFWKMALTGPLEYWRAQSHEIWAHLGGLPRSLERLSTYPCIMCPPPMWYRIKRKINLKINFTKKCFEILSRSFFLDTFSKEFKIIFVNGI